MTGEYEPDKSFKRIFRKKGGKILAVYFVTMAAVPLLTAAIMIFAAVSVEGTAAYMWEEIVADTEPEDIGLFFLIMGLYSIPFLIFYGFFRASRRQCRKVFQNASWEEKRQLLWILRGFEKGMKVGDVLTADHYFLYKEKWGFFFPRLIAYRDVVWLYVSQSNYDDMGMNPKGVPSVSSGLRFHTVVFYTRDRKRHSIFMGGYREILEHCPKVIQGYGREQKALAQEQFLKWESLGGGTGIYERQK